MSLDIDWSLLTPSAFSSDLVELLNKHLSSASRPSFIGPISVTSFDFGTSAPEVEIKDIRDVWRAFDEGDEEGDEELGADTSPPHPPHQPLQPHHNPPSSSFRHNRVGSINGFGSNGFEEEYEYVDNPDDLKEEEGDDLVSVYSGLGSPRQSVTAVGIGINSHGFLPFQSFAGAGIGPGGYKGSSSRPPSIFSPTFPTIIPTQSQAPSQIHGPRSIPPSQHLPPHPHSPPPSPPARPAGITDSKSSIPNLQLHLKINYISNLHLTLYTSLSVNYPSAGFMSLPLKLSITGFTLGSDVVLAYSGDKHRVHVCLIDDEEASNGSGMGQHVPIGQRIIPNLTMESEIGHSDAHVLRNVGKVERFIADVVRKTLVEELVFPNFLTLAL